MTPATLRHLYRLIAIYGVLLYNKGTLKSRVFRYRRTRRRILINEKNVIFFAIGFFYNFIGPKNGNHLKREVV